jgi:hypothetical protein
MLYSSRTRKHTTASPGTGAAAIGGTAACQAGARKKRDADVVESVRKWQTNETSATQR